jgi:hypothetical protein
VLIAEPLYTHMHQIALALNYEKLFSYHRLVNEKARYFKGIATMPRVSFQTEWHTHLPCCLYPSLHSQLSQVTPGCLLRLVLPGDLKQGRLIVIQAGVPDHQGQDGEGECSIAARCGD